MKKLMAAACLAGLTAMAGLASGQVVMSQVYSGGGAVSSTYKFDFIELFNRGNAPVSIGGWSVQYASATGNFSSSSNRFTLPAGVTLNPGQYYLIQTGTAAAGAAGADLPTPDAVTTQLAMAAGGAKVVLLNDANYATTGCPVGAANVVDFLGWGAGNCFEGTVGPGTSATTAAIRANHGCIDTNNNSADFSSGTPAPRNSASPLDPCGGGTPPTGTGASNPADACPGQTVVLTVTVTQGAPASAITSVVGDTTLIGGGPGESFFNDGSNGDAVAGDNIWTMTTTVFTSTQGARAVPTVITDALGRTGNASPVVNVLNCGMGGFFSAEPLCSGSSTLITFRVTPGQFPTSSGITATADLTTIGGPSAQQLFDNGSNGDVTAGDNTFSYLYAAGAVTPGSYTLTATATDAQSRTVNRTSTLNVGDCTQTTANLVISAIYGGGGNAGSTFTHDYVELFNRGTTLVSLNGMSIQYASGETDTAGLGVGTDRMHTLPNVTLQPGQYFLVAEAGSASTPTPDHTGAIAMSATRGTIALVNGTTALGTGSCGSALILDMVGYGVSNTPADRGYCHEGGFWAPTLDNATGLVRRNGGCWDTNNNGMDFIVYTPTPRYTGTTLNPCGGPTCPPGCGSQDYNGDGDFGTDQDIEAFFACLGGNCCASCFCGGSDFNGDGDFGTDQDIEAFFRVLGGGNC